MSEGNPPLLKQFIRSTPDKAPDMYRALCAYCNQTWMRSDTMGQG